MKRALALLLLAATPAWSQAIANDASRTSVASEAGSSADVEAIPDPALILPADPVAVWEADRFAILDAADVDLAAFEYLARPLVVFGDSPRQPQVEEQVRLIQSDLNSLALRDVVIILDTDPGARSNVRQELRPRGFGLVLVDKDGRVTLRRPAPLTVREITRAIDRTPIRQEELRTATD